MVWKCGLIKLSTIYLFVDRLVAKLLNYGIRLQNRIIELNYFYILDIFFLIGTHSMRS